MQTALLSTDWGTKYYTGSNTVRVRVENFVQFKILPYLENFAGINSTSHMYIIFVSSATHEKREIKNTSKFSTRTVAEIFCPPRPNIMAFLK